MRALSIRLRLTLWYSGVLGVILVFLGLFVYGLVARNLAREVDASLAGRAGELAGSVRVVPRFGPQWQVLLPDADVFAAPDTFVQVVDREGEVLDRSRNLGDHDLPATPALLSRATRAGEDLATLTVDGGRLRLYTRPLVVRGQAIGFLQVARSLRAVEAALVRLRLALLLGGGLVLLLAGTAGWFLARQAMTPIERITRAAEAVGEAKDLSRRVTHEGPADEVGRLAATFNAMLARLEDAHREVAEAYESQRRFVADASHELRTPLTVIRGNVDYLRKVGEGEPERRAEALADVAGEVERMSRLVGDLLVLARADAGLRLEKREVALGPLVAEAVRHGRRLAGDRVAVEAEGVKQVEGVEGPVVLADPDHLHRLLMILVDNAVKFSPDGCRVTLSARRGDGTVEVAVTDEGPGIPPEDLPHIFERFYRSDRARTRAGTGLGLAIAKWIAEEHGGSLAAESAPGRGTTFTVSLPAA